MDDKWGYPHDLGSLHVLTGLDFCWSIGLLGVHPVHPANESKLYHDLSQKKTQAYDGEWFIIILFQRLMV